MDAKSIMTVKEVAAYLQLSYRSVYRLALPRAGRPTLPERQPRIRGRRPSWTSRASTRHTEKGRSDMYVACVRVQVFSERTDEFIAATIENAAATRSEPGNVRFDILRLNDDPSRFFLYEVYRDEEAFKAHQRTPHYLKWKELVAPMMAVPRVGDKHTSLFPKPWE